MAQDVSPVPNTPLLPDPTRDVIWKRWFAQLYNRVATSSQIYHNSLAGLQGGTTDQYYHLTSSQHALITSYAHNNLTGLQGGSAGEYYHLTSSQHATVTAYQHNSLNGLQGGTAGQYYHLTSSQQETVASLSSFGANRVLYTNAASAISTHAALGYAETTSTLTGVNATLSGDLAVNGGDITTTSLTFNFVNSASTVVIASGAADSCTVGSGGVTGLTTIRGGAVNLAGNATSLADHTIDGVLTGRGGVMSSTFAVSSLTVTSSAVVGGDLAVNGGDITTTSTVATVFNANATRVTMAGGATVSTVIGNDSGSVLLRGVSVVMTGGLINTSTANATIRTTGNTISFDNPTSSALVVEVGSGITGDRDCVIDLHSDTTNTDYSCRLIRLSGVNGTLQLINAGTGDIEIQSGAGTSTVGEWSAGGDYTFYGGTITNGAGVSTADCRFELGGNRTGSGAAYIDFHAVNGTDYELRLIRLGGVNGASRLEQTGSGGVTLAPGSGGLALGEAATDSLTVAASSVAWSNNPTHSANHSFSGSVSTAALTVTSIAASRLLFTSTSGYVQGSSNLTFNAATSTLSAQVVNIGMGGSASFLEAVLKADIDTTSTGNVGTGEDDLITYSLPADAMNAAGRGVRTTAWGRFAATAGGPTRSLRCYFGTAMVVSTQRTTNDYLSWRAVTEVFSTGSNTQACVGKIEYYVSSLGSSLTTINVSTATQQTSSAIVIKCTGQTTAATNNHIVQDGQLVEFLN